MNILMAASEMSPYARYGSLADVLSALPSALKTRGNQVSVVLPLYRSVKEQNTFRIQATGVQFTVWVGNQQQLCEVFESRTSNGVQIFFISRDEYFDRSGIYGTEGRDYDDNAARYIFFSKCVLELARRLDPSPDIIHCHEWTTSLIPIYRSHEGTRMPVVLTIHDLSFQGNFWSYDFGLTNLPNDYFSPRGVEFYGSMNFLKGGILFADRVIFPSELFISEAKTPGHGYGLEQILIENSFKLVGIPDGVDYKVWNPETDSLIPKCFKASNLSDKEESRAALLERFHLKANPHQPVMVMVTRLLKSKGFDILIPALDRILSDDCRLIIIGEGDNQYAADLQFACKRHRDKLHFEPSHNAELIHWAFAGADILLAPARIESTGIRVMQALRYGAVPLVRACGGLRQIVEDYDPLTQQGNGIVFFEYSPDALVDAWRRSCKLFADKVLWQKMIIHAMNMDFSWTTSALQHEKLYTALKKITTEA